MSSRVCLFCGKPLSRMRVGGGEDFCSREHRNHYRLRRGMDQLQEANQMSSLMRRRENPKPLAAIVPGGEGVSLPRTLLLSAAAPPRRCSTAGDPRTGYLPLSRRSIFPLEESPFVQLGLPLNVLVAPRKLALPNAPCLPGGLPGALVAAYNAGRLAGMESCSRQREVPLSPSRGAALRVSLQAGFRRPGVLSPRHPFRTSCQRGNLDHDGYPGARCPRLHCDTARDAARGGAFPWRDYPCSAGPSADPGHSPSWRNPAPTAPGDRLRGENPSTRPQPQRAGCQPDVTGQCRRHDAGRRDSEIGVFVLANAPARGGRAAPNASVPFLLRSAPFGFSDEESHNR